jgi:hypothetical protein
MEVRQAFNFDDLSFDDLHHKLMKLSNEGKSRRLEDEELAELIQLSRTLRRRSGGPPKAKKAGGKKKGPITDDDLLA